MPSTSLSLRIDLPGGARFGPGKAALLKAIDEEGSISAAARALGMSYPRALRLVDDLNACFQQPLVTAFHGGKNRGGANLTETGADILTIYLRLAEKAEKATRAERTQMSEHIKNG